ncbi:MAG TPA: helix-turn-helix domain-containing protein [Pirellulales bacterium]|jgi:DNA-binding NtrC family response regulator
MALRTLAADLVRLFDAAAGPVFVLDDKRRIVFVNDACAAWTGCSANELAGQESRYHSSAEVTGPAAVAAALAPPPEVWNGHRASAIVSLAGLDGALIPRHVDFVPLGTDALEMVGVVAIASARIADADAVEALAGNQATRESSAQELHERLARWRRKLAGRFHLDHLLGDSAAMRQVRNQVELAAGSAASVTVIGPAGCGRQHVARAIHYGRAAQAAGSLVPLVCPLLSGSLLESTIRAMARASSSTPTARPATLLLCEADQLAAEAQEQLARSIASGLSFRIIATARESLATLAAQEKFRPDLACALSTVEIRLVRLVDRLEDLPLVAQRFVEEQNRQGGKQRAGLSPEAIDRLMIYTWPGNVAELAEVIAAAHAQAEGPSIGPGDLPAKIQLVLDALARPRKVEPTIVLEQFLARIEEELIRRALARAKGNKTKAARLLGMTRPRLYRRLVQLGLEKDPE